MKFMARQSQGLQVLLIVFVMLTVVLGVTTYLYSKRADEATKALASANQAKTQADQSTAEKQKEVEVLKAMIVGSGDKSMDEIRKQFGDDMLAYGGAKQPDADPAAGDKSSFDASTPYSRLLASLYGTIQARNDELINARKLAADYEEKFKLRFAAADNAVKEVEKNYGVVKEQMTATADVYHSTQVATAAAQAQTTATVARIKADATAQESRAALAVKSAKEAVDKKEKELQEVAQKLNEKDRPIVASASGEVTWVSLPNKMVWINRGHADNLQRQTQFTVFSGESVTGAKAVAKGKVEVTRITGEHEAEARIVEDKLTDPIMAGDKVFTPLWSPGQQNHFALAGIMNLDGDGRNQINVVRGLINNRGGVVDCELDEQGKKFGEITANTRYIVVGDTPDKASSETIKNNGEILRDADRYHVQVMKLGEFKQQMDYHKSSSVEHFSGASSGSDLSRAANAIKAAKQPAAKPDAGSTP
jgi:hypothetical protein